MLQQLIIYIALTLSLVYVGFRIYGSIKKKQACDKCALMNAAKEASKK
jgi:hypothetical protein